MVLRVYGNIEIDCLYSRVWPAICLNEPMIRIPNPLKPSFLGIILSLILAFPATAQMQPDIPQPRGPVDLSDTSNLVIFVILPALVIVMFFFWRKAMKKRKAEEEAREKEQKQ